MDMEYMTFVEDLKNKVLEELSLAQEKCWFERKGGKHAPTGDRLFIVCVECEDRKEICGIYTEELYQDYLRGRNLQEIIYIVKGELEQVSKNRFFEKISNLTDYEKVKSDLFIRLLNVEKHSRELETAVYR